jgi:hypothetical protein
MGESTTEGEATRSLLAAPRRCRTEWRGTAIARARELRLWGARGRGDVCDGCDLSIDDTQTDFEVEAELDGARVSLHFHRDCYDSWRAAQRSDNAIVSLHELSPGT